MRIIKQGMKELNSIAIVIAVVGMIAMIVSCRMSALNTAICYPIEIWIEGSILLDFFLPLFVAAPFSIFLFMKRKDGFVKYVSVRTFEKKYIWGQMLAGMIWSAIITFVIYFVGLVVAITILYNGSDTDRAYILAYVFGKYQANYPIAFGCIWSLWKAVIAMCFTHFGYRLAMYVDNVFVIAITPFIYVMAENLITGILQIPQFSVMTSYILNRLSPEATTIANLFVGIITFEVITSLIIIVLKRRKEKRYEICTDN